MAFCTGTLHHVRRATYPGEEAFRGPVVYGTEGGAEGLDFKGKNVTVVGLGAFAWENARQALLLGAARVDFVGRDPSHTMVLSRFARILNIVSANEYFEHSKVNTSPRMPVSWMKLFRDAYDRSGLAPLGTFATFRAGANTDVFFLAYQLGRLHIHAGDVTALEPGTVVVAGKEKKAAGEEEKGGGLLTTEGREDSGMTGFGEDKERRAFMRGEGKTAGDEVTAKVATERIKADIVIKTIGFEQMSHSEEGDLIGGVCEVFGPSGARIQTCRPPIWITPRVLILRYEELNVMSPPKSKTRYMEALKAELDALPLAELRKRAAAEGIEAPGSSAEDSKTLAATIYEHIDKLKPEPVPKDWRGPSVVGSASFVSSVWTDIYLHFRDRPKELEALLRGSKVPRASISCVSMADSARGQRAVLHFDAELRAKVNANRTELNMDSYRHYAPKDTPPERLPQAWALGFLEENILDWEDACRQLTGDPKAVPYLWEDILAKMRAEAAAP